MRNAITGIVAGLALAGGIGWAVPAATADEPNQILDYFDANQRLLDTRTIQPAPPNSFTIAVDAPVEIHDSLAYQLHVQVVQAAGDGWVEINGRTALVFDAGRASNSMLFVDTAPGGTLEIRLHGTAHVIVDLGPYLEDVTPIPWPTNS